MSCLIETSPAEPDAAFHAAFSHVSTAPPARTSATLHRASRHVVIRPRYARGPVEVAVKYLWCGAPNAPTVVVQGGISADRDVTRSDGRGDGWWQALAGDGAAIDLAHYRVLAIDWLAPADVGAESISTEDQAEAIAALLPALGVTAAHAFVGSSYGAMVALAFAARYPKWVDRLVLLAGAHRPHPLAIAQRSVQRAIVRLGQSSGKAEQALALARQLAMTTYRGSEDFARRFTGDPEQRDGRFHFPVEDYLEHAGQRFAERFDADRFLGLSESIDLHSVAPETIHTPATLIGFASDRLVPLADLCELQQRLAGSATLAVVDSPYGHDGFLKEPEQLGPLLREALL